MTKSIFFGVIVLLITFSSCSNQSTDKIVADIDNSKDLQENVTQTICGDITYKLDGDEVRKFYIERYMGDGGEEMTAYFAENKLIFCNYYSFYDGPMENEDGTWTNGGEAIGSVYEIYFEDEKMVKCLKDGVEYSNFKDIDPEPKYLVEYAKEIAKLVDDTESEYLCY